MRVKATRSQSLGSALLALVLALLVWIAATSLEFQQLTFPRQGAGIPIQLINLPEGVVVSEGQEQFVQIHLRMPSESVSDLQASDLVAEANLAGLEPGIHQLAVTVRPQPFAPSFRLLQTTPDRIIVRLDEVITRTLPIEVAIADRSTLPQTYQVLTTTVSPPTITITGPETLVEPIKQVVASTTINGARGPVVKQVVPQMVGLGESEGDVPLTLSAERVTVTVAIELRPGYRDLIVSTEIIGEPASGFWVSDIVPEPRLVTVVGQPEVISALNGIVHTEPINVQELGEGEIFRNAALRLPEGVSALSEGFVQVRIKIEPQTSSKRVSLPSVITGLRPGQVILEGGVLPPTVTVLLKGPVTELERLNLEDVGVTLDVTELPIGTHLVTPRVQPPGTLLAESVNPELVEVTIREEERRGQWTVPLVVEGVDPSLVAVVEPLSVTLDLAGPISAMQSITPTLQPVVDVTGLRAGEYTLTPTLALSTSVRLVEPPAPVSVTLYRAASVLTLTVAPTPVNLTGGLSVALTPTTIRLRVAGPGSAETLRLRRDFAVQVDLEGLGVGTHRLRPTIRLPDGYGLVEVVPESVVVIVGG